MGADDLVRRGVEVDVSLAIRRGMPRLDDAYEDDPYPVLAERAAGPYLWDTAGRRYLDLLLGYGAVVLGHADARVNRAVWRAIEAGVSRTLHSPDQVRLAELLRAVVPGAEMALFLKTGSDAVGLAVRLARHATGRDLVVRCGYHGWHDWCADPRAGIPDGAPPHSVEIPFNDLGAATEAARAAGGRLAAIVTMPYELEPPPEGHLAALRDLAHGHGALFVLDEVRSGFRVALGGAQERYGVTADLTALSKAIANGFAISAVTGRADLLRLVRDLALSTTTFRNADGIAAALATVTALRDDGDLDRLHRRGEELLAGLRQAAAAAGAPVTIGTIPSAPWHELDLPPGPERAAAERAFYAAAIERGVLLHPTHHWFVCSSMTEADVGMAVEAAHAGYVAAVRALGG